MTESSGGKAEQGIHLTGEPAASVPLVRAVLRSRCPRCDVGPLFSTWVSFAPRCRACGLDLTAFNVGDGPAAFLILILGGLVTALALMLQLAASPPFWVHILLWVPITTALVVYCLRVSKAALLIVEYRNQAREGRLSEASAQAEDPS
jgi:uncharacterized protein (DUF983 family)